MAKVTFSTDIQSISGKLCSKEGVIYSVNKRTGRTYRSDRHSAPDTNTAEQQAIRAAFTSKSKLASSWWASNKPTKEGTLGTDAYQKVMKAYKSQAKIGNPYSYLRSLVTDDLKVMLGTTDLTNGATTSGGPSSSSGGTSSGGGVEG